MKRRGRLDFRANLQAALAVLERINSQLARLGSEEDRSAMELGLAEVLTNIVRHGYGGEPGRIRVRWSAEPQAIRMWVCDLGRPIPPGSIELAASTVFDFDTTGVPDLPERGLGLALVHRVFHGVRYRSRGGVNRLSLVRRLH